MDTLGEFIDNLRKDESDCFNVCISFWKEHGLDLPFNSKTISNNIPVMKRFLSNFDIIYDIRSNRSNCNNLQYGDFLYVYMGYWGVCINENIMLTSTDKTRLFDLKSIRAENRLLSIFRPKKEIKPLYLPNGTEEILLLQI